MSSAPHVEPGEWIKIGSIDAVITQIRDDDLAVTELSIVCNPDRPAVYRVSWDGNGWTFAHPMRGDYAEHAPSAAPFLETLRRGPPKS